MAVFNLLAIGFLASAFATGSYSSWEQQAWYRYGSLGFLFFGAIVPAAGMATVARRSPLVTNILMVWMIAVLFACFVYAVMSGGGV